MPLIASYFLDVEYAHTHAFEYVGQNTEELKTFFLLKLKWFLSFMSFKFCDVHRKMDYFSCHDSYFIINVIKMMWKGHNKTPGV